MARSIVVCHVARSSGWMRCSRSSQVGTPASGSKPYTRYHSSERCKASRPATRQTQLPVCSSRRFSAPLDDEHALIVNTILFANLAETIVFFHGIFQQSVADFLCRLAIALTHHPFKLLTFFFVAAIVDPIGIEQENVPWTQQPELRHIGGVRVALPGVQ